VWPIEGVIAPDDAYARGKLLSLLMLTLFGARERTGEEYGALLRAAGFGNVTVHQGAPPWGVVEAVRP
jgi:hypothetical protein